MLVFKMARKSHGSLRHIIEDRQCFFSFVEKDGGYVNFGNNYHAKIIEKVL